MRASEFHFPSPLYPIVDTLGGAARGRSHETIAEALIAAGVRFFQLRIKNLGTAEVVAIARAVKRVADLGGAKLIINDRADVAKLVDAAGVHLGQNDLPVRQARALLGEDKIIGFSTHSIEQVTAAVRDGEADYVGFGPIFPTTSKINPDPVQGLQGLRAARRCCALPMVAIGGIREESMLSVLTAGADAVAMIGEIVSAEDIEGKVRRLLASAAPSGL